MRNEYYSISNNNHIYINKFKILCDGRFICEECCKICKTKSGLSSHITKFHKILLSEYYEKWIKTKDEGLCIICSKETKLKNLSTGYRSTCSEECTKIYHTNSVRESALKTYGVAHTTQLISVRDKMINTHVERYGVKYSAQNKEMLEKAQKTSLKLKKFKDTNLNYQGSYELDFLNKYYDTYPDMQRGPTLKYAYDNKIRYYHADFFIPSLNLVIECKNSYLEQRDKEIIQEKKNTTLIHGYNYIMIVSKIYDDFNNLIKTYEH